MFLNMKPRNYVAVTVAGFRSDSEIWQEVNTKGCGTEHWWGEEKHPSVLIRPMQQLMLIIHLRTGNISKLLTLTGEIERRFQSESFVLYTKIAICSQRRTRLTSRSSWHCLSFRWWPRWQGISLIEECHDWLWVHIWHPERNDLRVSMRFPTSTQAPAAIVCHSGYISNEREILFGCSFSKTYLRLTMKQKRLNNLMIIHIHREREINIQGAMSEFISGLKLTSLTTMSHCSPPILHTSKWCVPLCTIWVSLRFSWMTRVFRF